MMEKQKCKSEKNTRKPIAERIESKGKESGWIKFVRFLIYAISIIGVTIGASLIKVGGLSVAYVDGTYVAKIENGEIIFFTSLVVLYGNIMWGVLRWFLRGYREKWKPGWIIGKNHRGRNLASIIDNAISVVVLFSNCAKNF